MLKAFKYRIYPTGTQIELINKHIGSTRFVYNLALETKKEAYTRYGKTLSCFDLIKQIPDLKKECIWLKEINSQSLQMALRNLDNAFTNFFRKNAAFPKFKSKSKGSQSFNVPQNVSLKGGLLMIPKFKEGIKLVLHRSIKGDIKQATISRSPTGKYFVSILCDNGKANPKAVDILKNTTVGVDLGIKDFAIASNGTKTGNPKYLRNNLVRLKVLQRRASKKTKGSANRKKANLKIAKLHERITNSRKDFLHKFSNNLVKNHDTICIEDLAVSNMIKNHKLAQAISDVSWFEFTRQLEYKCAWNGKNLIKTGRFQPSTKTCSSCGNTNHNLTLSDREWVCEDCGVLHDRDINAAINIKNFALLKYSGVGRSVEPAELPSLEGTLKQEKFFSRL